MLQNDIVKSMVLRIGSDFKRISKYTEKVKINSTLLDLHNFQIYSDRGRTISLKLL